MTKGTDDAFEFGLSKREYFAAVVIQGLMANPIRYKYIENEMAANRISHEEATAKNANKAVMIADALIAALNKQ